MDGTENLTCWIVWHYWLNCRNIKPVRFIHRVPCTQAHALSLEFSSFLAKSCTHIIWTECCMHTVYTDTIFQCEFYAQNHTSVWCTLLLHMLPYHLVAALYCIVWTETVYSFQNLCTFEACACVFGCRSNNNSALSTYCVGIK